MVEVQNKDIYTATEMIISILRSLKESELADSECMKAGYTENADMLLDDAKELNFTLAYDGVIMNAPYKTPKERKMAYAAVTPTDIRRAASIIFKPENLTLTVKGNKSKIDTRRLAEIIAKL